MEVRKSGDSTQSERKRGVFSMKLATAVWKTVAVIVAIIVGIFASNTAGWNGGAAMLDSATYSGGGLGLGGAVNLTVGAAGFLGCIAVGYFVFRTAKWVLWLVVPIMLYSGLVAGTWNGIASDFDVTRGAVIRYHYANAYALRHMSAHAFDLTLSRHPNFAHRRRQGALRLSEITSLHARLSRPVMMQRAPGNSL